MTDRPTKERLIHGFFRAVDRRDWDRVAAGLARYVRLDYSSLFGGEPEDLTATEVIDRWRGLLPGFDATMHMLGPLVDGVDGGLECNVRGYHALGDEVWMVAGWYTLTLTSSGESPRIAGITLATSYETGSRGLLDRAQERVATG